MSKIRPVWMSYSRPISVFLSISILQYSSYPLLRRKRRPWIPSILGHKYSHHHMILTRDQHPESNSLNRHKRCPGILSILRHKFFYRHMILRIITLSQISQQLSGELTVDKFASPLRHTQHVTVCGDWTKLNGGLVIVQVGCVTIILRHGEKLRDGMYVAG